MSTELRITVWLGIILAIGGLLYLLAPVLTPFLAATLLAYLGDPVTDRLQKIGLSRTIAVVTVFVSLLLLLLLVLFFVVPLLEGQVRAFLQRLPSYLDVLQVDLSPWLKDNLGIDPGKYDFAALKAELSRHIGTVGGMLAGFLGAVSNSSLAIVAALVNIVLVPVVTFYLLRDWDSMIRNLHDLLPRSIEPLAVSLVKESDDVLGAFLKGQLMVMLALGTIYSIGLLIIGLDFALLIGMLAGIVSFVPYLGLIVGVIVAGIAALIQFQDTLHILLVVMVFGIGQAAEGVILTPIFVGDRIGLHPVAVIFAVLAGGHLFGFFGILLALPAAAIVMVLLRRAYRQYRDSALYE